jgi:hypothetical protein
LYPQRDSCRSRVQSPAGAPELIAQSHVFRHSTQEIIILLIRRSRRVSEAIFHIRRLLPASARSYAVILRYGEEVLETTNPRDRSGHCRSLRRNRVREHSISSASSEHDNERNKLHGCKGRLNIPWLSWPSNWQHFERRELCSRSHCKRDNHFLRDISFHFPCMDHRHQ